MRHGKSKVAGVLTWVLVAFSLVSAARAEEIRGRVVAADGEAIADAVVFVTTLPEGLDPDPEEASAVMDQVNKEFVPHILPVVAGTEVSFPNHDQIHHHVYSFSRPKTFEIPLYKGETAPPVRFDQEGAVKIGCNIHDWMSAVILVVPNRYFAKTDESGRFRIADLPAGRYSVAAWHERSRSALVEATQEVEAGDGVDVTFRLDLAPPQPRPGMHGMRSWE